MNEHQLVTTAASAMMAEELRTFGGQHDVTRLAGLGLADRQATRVRVEVTHLQARQLAKACAGLQRSPYQRADSGSQAVINRRASEIVR